MKSIRRLICKDLMKQKFIILFVLNITDLLFSWFFLYTQKGIFFEANPLMSSIVYDMPTSSILKIGITVMVIIYWNFRLRKATEKEVYISNLGLNICVLFYVLVNILHLCSCCFIYIVL